MPTVHSSHDLSVGFDRLGFPTVIIPALGLACHLFPTTKVQFEYYLGGTPMADTTAYTEMLALCPRVSWRTVGEADGLFAAAARPADAGAFARWLGDGFRLPTADEWCGIDAALDLPMPASVFAQLTASSDLHPCAGALLAARAAGTWRRIGWFDGGLLEWVRCPDETFGLYGRPRPKLLRTVSNPQRDRPLRPTSDQRHPAFGFRLVRPLDAGSHL